MISRVVMGLYVWALLNCAVWAQDGVALVDEGQPVAAIVLSDAGSGVDREAADLLVEHIALMSGGKLPIVKRGELGDVTVDAGRLKATKAPAGAVSFIVLNDRSLAAQLGVSDEGLRPGGLRLVAAGNTVILLGGPTQIAGELGVDAYGVRHAVIDLLERQGCRQLWPGEVGRVTPQRRTIRVEPVSYSFNPQIRCRGIRMNQGGEPRYNLGLKQLNITAEALAAKRAASASAQVALPERDGPAWMRWQRLGGSMPGFGHAGGGLRQGYDVIGQTHPDWFAMQNDGTRTQRGDRWTICTSNPQLIEHIARDIIAQTRPGEAALISLDFNDGSGDQSFCLCPTCEALDPADAPKVEVLLFGAVDPATGRRTRSMGQHAPLTDRYVHY